MAQAGVALLVKGERLQGKFLTSSSISVFSFDLFIIGGLCVITGSLFSRDGLCWGLGF